MRPVVEGHVRYRELLDGTYTLDDIAKIVDALEVRDENQARAQAAARAAQQGGR